MAFLDVLAYIILGAPIGVVFGIFVYALGLKATWSTVVYLTTGASAFGALVWAISHLVS